MRGLGRSIRLRERLIGRGKIRKAHFETLADEADIGSLRNRRDDESGKESKSLQRGCRR
ncbi:hypothetical protein [Parvibaculum sp.]|uniref:hypothetical protein n=1 Tax=Parvibaculum sp. TaxID=2024848 RepID=UPI003210C8B5